MSNHQKRLSVPKSWPVERKTETFTVAAGAGPHGEAGVPLLVVLRDVLGYVDSRKEARFALDQGSVLVNGDTVTDETRPIGMFDILAFQQRGEFYRVFPDEGGRLALTPVDAEAAGSRLGKVVSKQHVPGGDVQLTFHDGTNIRVEDDTAYGGGDSVVVDTETKEVVAHFPYEEGALVTAVAGQHAGEIGEIDAITVTPGSNDNAVTVDTDDGGFETVEEYIVVIDENFVDSGESAPDADELNGEPAPDADDPSGESTTDDGAGADEESASDDEAGTDEEPSPDDDEVGSDAEADDADGGGDEQ